jgi:hypothetical protein
MTGSRVEDYRWADTSRDRRLEAISVTLVEPADDGVVAALAPRRELPGRLTIERALAAGLELDDFAWGSLVAQVDELGGWSVIVEPNGWAASTPAALARLSRLGRAFNVCWNVNADMTFGAATGGAIVRQFDPLLYDDADDRLAEEAGLPFGRPEQVRAASLALLTRLTGVGIDPTWLLDRERRTFIVRAPTDDP